jgi:hypothetical protein
MIGKEIKALIKNRNRNVIQKIVLMNLKIQT